MSLFELAVNTLEKVSKMRLIVPSVISALRLVVLPFLIYSIVQEMVFLSYGLFLFSIATDFIDGYVARKLGTESRSGAYFDVVIDFLFISGVFMAFIYKGFYPLWLILPIVLVFLQFVLSTLYLEKVVYDPIGKYYGSLLFGAIGLTLLFSEQLVYDIVAIGIIVATLASLSSRLAYFLRTRNRKPDQSL